MLCLQSYKLTFHDRINAQLIYRFELAQVVARRITKPQRQFFRLESHWLFFLSIHFFYFRRGDLILLFSLCLFFSFYLFYYYYFLFFLSL